MTCKETVMEVISQKIKLPVKNIDNFTVDGEVKEGRHGYLFPDSFRCLITGPSNCGKTNVLFNLLTDKNGLRFNNVYIFAKSLHQPKYVLLEKILSEVPEVGYFKFDANEDLIPPHEAKPHSVFIFDDISCEKHDGIRTYFAMGRHSDIDSIYIGQTYSKIPKQLIRDNANILVVFKQDELNLKHLYIDHVNVDMTFENFKNLCAKAWNNRFGFVVIAKENDIDNGRYRIGFDGYVNFK